MISDAVIEAIFSFFASLIRFLPGFGETLGGTDFINNVVQFFQLLRFFTFPAVLAFILSVTVGISTLRVVVGIIHAIH